MTRPRALVAGAVALVVLAAAGCGDSSGAAERPERGAPDARAGGEALVVAAAADLRPAFEALADDAEAAAGREITYVFGSSGQLAQQAREGAPIDVFASADGGYVDDVLASGRGDADTRTTYAYGRVVLWARDAAWGDWDDLADLADEAGLEAFAIANPEHAPYGVAGREALEATGVWDEVADRVVYGENIADAQRLVASGNADAGIVALSLAIAAGDDGRWLLLDEDLHAPLRQDLVVLAEDPERAAAAEAFVDTVTSGAGREVMRDHGFLLPGDEPPEAWER